ncbi:MULTISPECIES: AbrB/MazE/SpoVT family DNA-binding domain-containing protein [Gracilibacillus]|uniref:AbrB/MazE/SpoVT family DNA-binding domain-containing protein n=1 Tax=Gracilibacillus TaxID=74385 RepID=UPI0008268F9A|nr:MULTISPECIES: AbrB/MazE/SpoVT family DNA-binding domain-containing protein [Gracilibacillus]
MVSITESRDTMPGKSVRLRGKNQVTIPTDVIEQLQLKEGEQLEVAIENGRIVLIPVITIERDQAWFWTEEWQKGEREADEDIKAKRVKSFKNPEEAIKWLDSDEADSWVNEDK